MTTDAQQQAISLDTLTYLRLLASGSHDDATALMSTYGTADELKHFMAALCGVALLMTGAVAAYGGMTAEAYLSAWAANGVSCS